MPANPDNIQRREELSDDYQDKPLTIDFYTNSALAIYRVDHDTGMREDDRVWMDNLEKRELLRVLLDELSEDSGVPLGELEDLIEDWQAEVDDITTQLDAADGTDEFKNGWRVSEKACVDELESLVEDYQE